MWIRPAFWSRDMTMYLVLSALPVQSPSYHIGYYTTFTPLQMSKLNYDKCISPMENRIISIDIYRNENFRKNLRLQTLWSQKEWRNFVRAESRTSWPETKKLQIKLVTSCNKNWQQQGGRNMPNCIENGRRWLGRALKGLLGGGERVCQDVTGDMMMMMMMMMVIYHYR